MEKSKGLILGQRLETLDGAVRDLNKALQGLVLSTEGLELNLVLGGSGVLAGSVGALGVASLACRACWLLVVTL